MLYTSWCGHRVRSVFLTLCFLSGAMQAFGMDSYDASTRQLTIPSLQIGDSTYSTVVVSIGRIVSGPAGATPNGSEDRYDPGTNQLSVQSVSVGSGTYYNVVVTVAGLVSIGGVVGADIFNGTELTVAQVQAGGTVFGNVTLTEAAGNIVGVAGGMPTAVPDTYSPVTNQLSVPAVQAGNRVYTNVVVTAGELRGIGGVSFRNQESILHDFAFIPVDGLSPLGGAIQAGDGNFYATTQSGGAHNLGAVIKVTAAGAETVFYSFGGGTADGAVPTGRLVQGGDGNFYGTTSSGGAHGSGTFFRITPAGVETMLYSFAGGVTDGAAPSGNLIQGSDANFYGTTAYGGANSAGTVFRITPAGSEAVRYSFAGGTTDGATPNAGLVQDDDANLYGTTYFGGTAGNGTVFKLTPGGTESVLYSFGSVTADGASPSGGLFRDSGGNFYGATALGGASGAGTIFRIAAVGTETVLYSFGNVANDGTSPQGALTLGNDGGFYGTTNQGGSNGDGTVFRITSAGVETVLYSFGSGPADGLAPTGGLIQGSNGNFYGTTPAGGSNNVGTLFEITPAGAAMVLHSFSGGSTDGVEPAAGLVQGSDGNFYGSTASGGASNVGAVVRITAAGAETVFFSFGGGTGDGAGPAGRLVVGSDGNFYGATSSGGTSNNGTVFRITPTGAESLLHSFAGGAADGASPNGSLVEGSDGALYGTTSSGGTNDSGTVFRITPGGDEKVLYSFPYVVTDGFATPNGGLLLASDGNFYGTTQGGGIGDGGTPGCTVFRITPAGVATVLYAFGTATNNGFFRPDGWDPNGELIQDSDGSFYGTTAFGGGNTDGIVFKITPGGIETVLYSFQGGSADGSNPFGGLIHGSDGNFYGTTTSGGASGQGTVYKITPLGVETVLYSFGSLAQDGVGPRGILIQGSDGSFYGTAQFGGTTTSGVIFKLTDVSPVP